MAIHECPLCGESCGCHGAGRFDRDDSERCFHVCDPEAFDDEMDFGPIGSCEDCGVNLYGDEQFDGFCDQCSWARSQGRK